MKSFRVLNIARLKKTVRRIESAGKMVSGVTFSRVENFSKALDLMESVETGLVIIYDEFEREEMLGFLQEMQSHFRSREIHIWICGKHEKLVEKGLEHYKAGVIDFLDAQSGLGTIRTKLEVFKRLYVKRMRIRQLLENMLPAAVAQELENRGKYPPRRHGLVTVMFTDFVRFTEKAEQISPVELVKQLDWYYKHFDRIIKKYKLEKIKTIGDAYMCAGGVPLRKHDNPLSTCLAAMEINHFLLKTERQNNFHKKPIWKARIGLNSGDLVSGIVGDLKYTYDIWGETVNVAARLEGKGEPGKINISESTYNYVKEYFNCTYRGKIEAKYMGKVKMYFLESIKPEYSIGGNGKSPTRELLQRAGIIRVDYEGARKYILSRLRNELPEDMYYHGVHHTHDVLHAVENLVRAEDLCEDDILLLRTAALYHDAGYLVTYENNEEKAVSLVRKILPKYGYSHGQISIICSIIRSTKQRARPVNLLQKIMRDADHDYLGRKDYAEIAHSLYREKCAKTGDFDRKNWVMMQIRYLEKHEYYTPTARQIRDKQKILNLKVLRHALKKR